ncbi:translation initiation factor eIF3 subunit [Friedmanniomyces endolithicus]|nr:translation initiation factor eIF3 subunit [Friedmanniomyces endolithicus]KAK0256276.1 translation initiation factor eIF3 subunit [Friedmanniomyces endolithicus]KAK0278525.1 translation initiation factor eIF3 subunit [Friedmanniomyces endolithicus]KAK0338298.1 translation initiation factor eIF3 subunit [Friedmanniomyces endolithicus]KAK0808371.1 translation initiation factor eIF3 subunit [Friedmanniomyces endolithicus]
MRPILLQGHERALTQVKFSKEGDLLFSVSKDHVVCAWYSSNGERFGTYKGHQGALWTVDVDPTTTFLATGGADNTMRLWEVKTGKELKQWEYPTSIRRVEFSEDGRQLLGVTEKRTGQLSNIYVYDIAQDVEAEQTSEPSMHIVVDELPRVTVAGFSFMSHYIITGHENGSVAQWDAKTGELIKEEFPHDDGMAVTDLQWSADRTYFITASKDKTAKLIDSSTLEVLKTYVADTPLNSAAITPEPTNYVILGGGQAAMDVTTTSARQGKFEARFYHKIFEEEIGRVRGHFGPLNYVAVSPDGKCYCSGGEDGYVRVHHFDPPYFDFKFEVEKEKERENRL